MSVRADVDLCLGTWQALKPASLAAGQVLQPDGGWWRFPEADQLTTDGDNDGLELAEADQLSAPEIADEDFTVTAHQVTLTSQAAQVLLPYRDRQITGFYFICSCVCCCSHCPTCICRV